MNFCFLIKLTYPDDTDDIELNEVCDVRDDGEWLDDDDVCDMVEVNEFRLAVSPTIVDGLLCTFERCACEKRRREKKMMNDLCDGHDRSAWDG